MNLPLRPLDGHGQTFVTTEPFTLIAYLASDGWALVADTPERVQLTRGLEQITITANGAVTPTGNEAHKTAHALLMICEE